MSRPMRAHVKDDWAFDGIRFAIEDGDFIRIWGDPTRQRLDPETEAPTEAWGSLREDEARALYEALADYFGHSGNDVRALRRDYEAERARVDKFIAHLTEPQP